jgi:hypothetical protein
MRRPFHRSTEPIMTTLQTPSAGPLSPAQLEQYDRDGYLVVRGLYSDAQMVEWKRILREVFVADAAAKGLDHWSKVVPNGIAVWTPWAMHPAMRASMQDAHVTPILRQLIGPHIEFLGGKAVFKASSTIPTPWHQDAFYWEGTTKTSVWIALDDATPDNGCLIYIPGSHKRVFPKTVHAGKNFINRVDEQHLAGLPRETLAVKRGDAVFFHDRAMHASHPNTTGKDRWSFISTYRDASVVDDPMPIPKEAWKKPMLVCGASVNGGVRG